MGIQSCKFIHTAYFNSHTRHKLKTARKKAKKKKNSALFYRLECKFLLNVVHDFTKLIAAEYAQGGAMKRIQYEYKEKK